MSFILGADINWSLTAFATPDPDYRWFDPKGHLIDFDIPQTLTKYDLDVDSKTHRITLTIKHLQLYDMGHYILEILVNEGSSQVRHYMEGNALAQVQRVHEPADLWDIPFCTR